MRTKLPRRMPELARVYVSIFAELLEDGLGISDACKHEGVSVNTFKRWYKIGKSRTHGDKVSNDYDVYVDFYLKISKARVTGRRRLLETIRLHASKDWKACVYLLERMEKSRFVDQTSAAPACVQAQAIEAAKLLLAAT